MENTSYHDSSYSPNEACEAANPPNCYACGDGGFIDEQETVYCDCAEGDLMAEIDAEFRAEEKAEACATDYAYAVDSQGDDSPPSDW